MKKGIFMRKLFLLALVAVVAISLASCCYTQKGTAIGGVAGAGAGAIVGAVSSIETGPGAAGGALIGGVIGALIGDHLEHKKTEEEIAALKKRIAELEAQNKEKDDEISRLKALLAQKEKEIADLKKEIEELKKKLEKTDVNVEVKGKIICLTIGSSVLFKTGSNDLCEKGKETLDSICDVLKNKYPENEIGIAGHTDTQPIIGSGKWKSNWELASGRSLSVLHYFVDEKGFPASKIFAASYGEFRPVAENLDEDGRAKNRRVEIMILPTEIEKQTVNF